MEFITFAHRGEANFLIKNLDLRPYPFIFDGVYINSDETLLLAITGEGIESAGPRVSALCGHFYGKLTSLINLGIAGALPHPKEVDLHKIYEVRTALASKNSEEMEFKTYESGPIKESGLLQVDCVTAKERVLNPELAVHFSHFGHIVDRELWAVAQVANLFQLPFYSFKLISDKPHESQTEVCERAKELAASYSQSLGEFYLKLEKLNPTTSKNTKEFPLKKFRSELLRSENFHFTVSQKRRFVALTNSLSLKFSEPELKNALRLQDILEREMRPKEKTKELLERLLALLNPFQVELKNKVKGLTSPIEKLGGEILFSENYEDEDFEILLQLNPNSNWKEIKEGLDHLSVEKIQDLLKGRPRV